ncbi:MAG TPA: histidine--tRNA ligase [Gammaproteobacteria bacterium]|nr:histidine--tRNA ligase [Gammaproteobacteria bacterium]
MKKIQAIRGMNDILPEGSPTWQFLESRFSAVVKRFGYREIRFPILEQTQLFKRSIGEVTDIVEKEMYSFDDRNGDNLSLRPEGTAGCVRAADQHGLLYHQQQRLWYQGPMFRHERPQRGRYRQFHQFGVEAFGMSGPDIDAELIQISATVWQELGLLEFVKLELNNIGSAHDRCAYGRALTAFLEAHESELDADARRRMHSNPMRVLDSKSAAVQSVLADAPALSDFVSQDSCDRFEVLEQILQSVGINYVIKPNLVRGLDYYNNCVFEWTTEQLGAQSAVCGGGRYDGLAEQLGGRPTAAAGFAMGVERLVLMLETLERVPESYRRPVDAYVLTNGEGLFSLALRLAEEIRALCPGRGIVTHCGGGKYNSQIKRAFSAGARFAVVLETAGEDSPVSAKIRNLAGAGETSSAELSTIPAEVARLLEA